MFFVMQRPREAWALVIRLAHPTSRYLSRMGFSLGLA